MQTHMNKLQLHTHTQTHMYQSRRPSCVLQVNLFLLRISIPVFTVYQLGIRLDLTDVEAWRTLAA